ncbi:MAG: hypothetical protein CMI27_01905 [Opitutae bacterium]|nr:hypothetical protein [Opitutae bacterium]|tara:strand:+ start:3505 stop:3921 length:417 start_codon:yes stop_codon:yes gene_type:complete
MKDDPFPTPPGPEDIPVYRRIPTTYYWWFGSVVLLGITIIWLPTQCTMDSMNLPDRGVEDLSEFKKLDQDKGMEFREDGLWYEIGAKTAFSGLAEAFHQDGKLKSRTKIKNGTAYGLIEEWDENGTLKGTRFKGEFSP